MLRRGRSVVSRRWRVRGVVVRAVLVLCLRSPCGRGVVVDSDLRSAVCIAGLERSMSHVINSIEENLLRPLAADAFFVVQTVSSREAAAKARLEAVRGVVLADVSSTPPAPLKEVLLSGHAKNMTWFKHLLVEKSDKPHGVIQIWQRWSRCLEAVRTHELSVQRSYDFVAFTRTDLAWFAPAPSLRVFAAAIAEHCGGLDKVVFGLDGEEYGGINDRFFLTTRSAANFVGEYFWASASTFDGLEAVFTKLLGANFIIPVNMTMGIEVLALWFLVAQEACIPKFSSVASLVKPDGKAKFLFERATAEWFGILMMDGARWDVVRAPFLVGARCAGLERHCCHNAAFGGSLDCWLWYRLKGKRLYSLARCCQEQFVQVALVPTIRTLRGIHALLVNRSGAGGTVDPEVSMSTVPGKRRNARYWCSPCQPEDCLHTFFNPDHIHQAGLIPDKFFTHMPTGSVQCYDVDMLLRPRSPQRYQKNKKVDVFSRASSSSMMRFV
eukprot:TRINITY_DN7431_c0_g2_i2.p1 TRINITY_DN7431_c0_g2~~TRINITY_DN7431_c0_g2_i2.p1  ORF type:complete len:496 (-),score=59.18 TRINITY_DN7431_c0_g2_i2:107-1594(-)